MVTIDSLWELTNALSNGTIADPLYDVPFSHSTKRYRQTTDKQTDDKAYQYPDCTKNGRLKLAFIIFWLYLFEHN